MIEYLLPRAATFAGDIDWLFTATFAALSASPALACPNCFSAKENVLWAYYSTAIGLSLLPFALFAAIALYWYKKRGQTPFPRD